MKISWVIYLFFVFGFVCFLETNDQFISRHPSSERIERHVVFDLDWTLFSEFDPKIIHPDPERVFIVEGKSYYLSPHAKELVRFLHESGIQISFFSGGHKERNLGLLRQVEIEGLGTFEDIAFQTLHREHLTILSTDESLPFTERYKKDLKKVHKNLDEIIILDDDFRFVVNSDQKKNMFWLGPTYQVLERYDQLPLYANTTTTYLPATEEAFDLAKNKLLVVKEALREAMFLQDAKRISWREAVFQVQEKLQFKTAKYNQYSLNLKRKGMINKIHSGHRVTNCQEMMLPFIKI